MFVLRPRCWYPHDMKPRLPFQLLKICAAVTISAFFISIPHAAVAQLYIYNGPFTVSGGTGTANPWGTDSWIGGTPVSSPNTELLFTASDFLATNNDLGNPFSLNRVTLRAFSSQLVTGSLAGNQLGLTGAEPTVIAEGPGGSSFGTAATDSALLRPRERPLLAETGMATFRLASMGSVALAEFASTAPELGRSAFLAPTRSQEGSR